MRSRKYWAAVLGTAASLMLSAPASATLQLTAAGIADGFVLSTFVSGYDFGGNYGPLSQGILPSGNVVTGSVGDGKIYVFKDVDNQVLGDAISATPYTFTTGNPHYAVARAGSQVYGAQLFGGVFEQFFNDGSHTPVAGAITSQTNYLGMWGNPVDGHLIAMSFQNGLIDINPADGSFRVIKAGVFGDGVTVSPDGKTVYVEQGGAIVSYDILTGNLIRIFSTGHSPDGTGVITGGVFDGQIIVNNNDGTVGLLDPSKTDIDPALFTIIADSGTRGDFVSPDLNNGTLFLSQIERVMRLSCGPGCAIGGLPPPVGLPEPDSLALLGVALAGLVLVRRRNRNLH